MRTPPPPGTPQHLIDLVNKLHEKTDHMEKILKDMHRDKMRVVAGMRTNQAFQKLVEEDREVAREADRLERIVLGEERLEKEKEAEWAAEDAEKTKG